MVTAAGQAIEDGRNQAWTIVGGIGQPGSEVALNGTADTSTGYVKELAYVNHTLWQENTGGGWYSWQNPGWSGGSMTSPVAAAPPPPPPPPPPAPPPAATESSSGTVVTTGGPSIEDGHKQAWTIVGGIGQPGSEVALSGTADTSTGYVKELAYVNHTLWQENTGGSWYSWQNPGWSSGTLTSPIPAPMTAPGGGSGPDTLVLNLSEDAYKGDAQFKATVNGTSLGAAQTVTALHAANASEAFTFKGSWGAGPLTVGVSFINDAWGGTAATDRNLYVNSLAYDGKTSADKAALYGDSTATFTVGSAPAPSSAPGSATTGSSTTTVNQTLRTSPGTDILQSGHGSDTLFIDTTSKDGWATIMNWHGGDLAALLGVDWNVAKLTWVNGQDPLGHSGATLDVDLHHTGHTDAAITFAGVSVATAQSASMSSATYNGQPFLALHA